VPEPAAAAEDDESEAMDLVDSDEDAEGEPENEILVLRLGNACRRMFEERKTIKQRVLTSLTEILGFVLWLTLGIFITID
jgi:hypothetical protein